jgi:hypothetical protein
MGDDINVNPVGLARMVQELMFSTAQSTATEEVEKDALYVTSR